LHELQEKIQNIPRVRGEDDKCTSIGKLSHNFYGIDYGFKYSLSFSLEFKKNKQPSLISGILKYTRLFIVY